MLLDRIQSPQDLKRLTPPELAELAQEIRDFLITHVAVTGGHLAPNLGVVELTIALHAVLNSPRDKIVWDVGHQAYVHKILTGRKDVFHTLRQYEGLSGFPRREESPHDAFGTGHSSTSISAALGIAVARDMRREKFTVAAVIGDGSMTGGQAFEGLNHAGHLGINLVVVLNDNEMSIAKNVGALAGYLSKLRTAPSYSRLKGDVKYLLRRIPRIGNTVARTAERLKDTLKHLVVPGMLFEELGFTYVGPIDGHNIPLLMTVLSNARNMKGPVLVHVVTKKGYGYPFAEKDPDKFHGIGPFCIATGQATSSSDIPTYTAVFGRTLVELAKERSDIVAITAAMPEGTGLKPFAAEFPQRFFDVGIAEPHAVTFAAGLATQGMKPVVAIYSTFLQRAFDQVIHDVCLQELPVVFAIDRGGIVGEDGATHQGVFDLGYLREIPRLVVMAPKDENELRHMLRTAVEYPGPIAFRYPRGSGVGAPWDEKLQALPIGKGEMLREGGDIALVAVGAMVHPALEAAELLAKQGISATVVNARFVKPLDEALLARLCREIGRIVTIEDNVITTGFGAAVLEYLDRNHYWRVKILRLGLPDTFIEHGGRQQLLEKYGLTPAGITNAVRTFLRGYGVR